MAGKYEEDRLRVIFPLAVKKGKAYRDQPFTVTPLGYPNGRKGDRIWGTQRTFEALNWVDIVNQDWGCGLLIDRTSGVFVRDNVLSLILAFGGPASQLRFTTDPYGYLQGEYEWRYTLYSHAGNWEKGNLVSISESKCHPLLPFIDDNPTCDDIGQPISLIQCDNNSIVLSATEVIEGKLIVRFVNYSEKEQQTKITFPKHEIITANLVNLLHESIKEVAPYKNGISLDFAPFGIATLKLKFK